MRALVSLSVGVIVLVTVVLALATESSQAAYPGANGAIFFTAEADGGGLRIFSRPAAGGARTQLTDVEDTSDYLPAVSPDGSRVAFTRQQSDLTVSIWVMDADGTNQEIVPNTLGGEDPYWTPDGEHILFSVLDNSIFEIHPDGTDKVNLTPDLPGAEDPAASPDGSKVAFVVIGDESHLYVMDADGSNPMQITPEDDLIKRDPDWSPDSQQIVFATQDRDTGDFDVLTINADGTDSTNLTDTEPGSQSDPAFSPDGTKIVYAQRQVFGAQAQPQGLAPTELFIMNTDGSDKDNFTEDSLLKEFAPDWQRAEPPTPSPSPSPTDAPGQDLLWADADCDDAISSRDNQAIQRNVLEQNPLSQTEPCPDIGESVSIDVPQSQIPILKWGDADCDGSITTRDNQAVLRNVLQQNPLGQTEPCPDVGSPVIIPSG